MNFNFISEKSGLLTFENIPFTNKQIPNYWHSYSANGGFGSIQIRTQNSPSVHAYLIEINAAENDFLHFTTLTACKNTLVFVFLNSLHLYLTSSKKKLFHDRSCNLATNTNDFLGMSIQKDHRYIIILLCFTWYFLEQQTEISIVPKIPHNIYPSFYYSKLAVITKEAIDLLSILFFDDANMGSGNLLIEEISGSLLIWLLEPLPARVFQPGNLSLDDAELFYQQKNRLLYYKHKNISYSALLHQAGITDPYSFRRKMKQLYGLNIRDFVTEARLGEAVSLLKEGNLSIKEIAFKTGFVNAAYFSRVFTNYFGLSPKHLQQYFLR